MTIQLTPDLTRVAARKLALLEKIYNASSGNEKNWVVVDDDLKYEQLERDSLVLAENGLLRTTPNLSEINEIAITSRGITLIKRLIHHRDSPEARNESARDAVLCWLFDQNLDSIRFPSIDDFSDSTYNFFYGSPYTNDEIASATTWLRENEFVTEETHSEGTITHPGITARGQEHIESGASVNS